VTYPAEGAHRIIMMNDFAVGTLLALGAALLFGAHTSFAKVKSVRESRVPVPIYNIYFLIGAALVCFVEYFVMIGLGISSTFTYLGIICAFLLLCFETFLVLSIQQIGVGYATGFMVFASSVITPIVQIILGQPIASVGIMVLGLIMLAFSVFLMSILRDALKFFGLNTASAADHQQDQQEMVASGQSDSATVTSDDTFPGMYQNQNALMTLDEHTPLVSQNGVSEVAESATASRCAILLGLLFSSLAGGFLAVLPLPSLYATTGSVGTSFFLSFGVGCLVVVPLSAIIVVFTERGDGAEKDEKSGDSRGVVPYSVLYQVVTFSDEAWHFKQVLLPAMSAGIVWSLGNICGFMSFLYLSYTIAVSFVQCNVIVAMFLSIVLWREITNAVEIGIMFALSLLLVGGCAVVVYGVFGSFE